MDQRLLVSIPPDKTPVRVPPRRLHKHEQLNRWYRAFDALLSAKDLFSVNVDVAFYDLTGTYFCRKSIAGVGGIGFERPNDSTAIQWQPLVNYAPTTPIQEPIIVFGHLARIDGRIVQEAHFRTGT